MPTKLHPALIGFTVLVFFFLVGPLVIVFGAAAPPPDRKSVV